jgi:chromosome segregation ATPase
MASQYPDQVPFVQLSLRDQTIQINQVPQPQSLSADLLQARPTTTSRLSPSLPPNPLPTTIDGQAPTDSEFSLSQLNSAQHALLSSVIATVSSFDSTRAMFKRVRETEAALTARDAEVQSLTLELKVKEDLVEVLRVKVDEREEMLVNRGRELDDTLVDLRAASARIERLDGEYKVLLELSDQQTMEVAALQAGIDASKQREADLNTRLADSKARIKDLEGQVMNANAMGVTLSSQIRDLENHKANLEIARNEAEQRRLAGEERISELGSEAEVLRKELHDARSGLEQSEHTNAIMEGQLKQAIVRERELSDHLSAYEREIDDSKAELSKIGEQQAQSRQEREGLRFEQERVLENLTNLQSQLEYVTSSLETAENEIHHLSAALQIAQAQVEERDQELERVRFEARESSVSFSERIGALNAIVNSTHDDLQSARQSLADKRQEHQKLVTTHAQLESQHRALVLQSQSDSTRTSGEVARLTAAIKERELKLQATTEALYRLESKLTMSGSTLGERSKELEESVKEITALKKERGILQKSLDDAQQELANEVHERTMAEDAATATFGEFKAQEDELSELRSHLVDASVERREELEVMQSEILHARVEVEALKNRIEKLTLERDDAMKEVEGMRDGQRKYVKELESKIRANPETVETIKVKTEVTEMQMTQLQDLLACNDSLIAEMRVLRAQIQVKEEKAKEYQRRAWAAEKSLHQAVEENVELRDAERLDELEQTLNFRDAMIKDLQNQLAQAVAENADIRRALMGQRDEAMSNGRKRVRMY